MDAGSLVTKPALATPCARLTTKNQPPTPHSFHSRQQPNMIAQAWLSLECWRRCRAQSAALRVPLNSSGRNALPCGQPAWVRVLNLEFQSKPSPPHARVGWIRRLIRSFFSPLKKLSATQLAERRRPRGVLGAPLGVQLMVRPEFLSAHRCADALHRNPSE